MKKINKCRFLTIHIQTGFLFFLLLLSVRFFCFQICNLFFCFVTLSDRFRIKIRSTYILMKKNRINSRVNNELKHDKELIEAILSHLRCYAIEK